VSFRTIIFDLDGTLVDTAPDVRDCANRVLAEMGLPRVSLAKARHSVGPGSMGFTRVILPPTHWDRSEEFIQRFQQLYKDRLLVKTRLFPYVESLLEALSDRQLIIATNKRKIFTLPILEGLGIRHYFREVIGPEDVNHNKPQPDMILQALMLTQTPKEQTLMVGDTENDILSAHAAGIKVCAVSWGYAPKSLLKRMKPDFIIDQPLHLIPIAKDERPIP